MAPNEKPTHLKIADEIVEVAIGKEEDHKQRGDDARRLPPPQEDATDK